MTQATTTLVGETDLQLKIINLLWANGPMTRGDLVKQLQVSRTTIYYSLAKLMTQNVVDKDPINNNKRGRPKVVFSLKSGIVAL